jgi:hypothetical protein
MNIPKFLGIFAYNKLKIMAPLMIAGLVAQGLGSGFGAIKGAQMMKQAKAINPAWNLKESQAAKQMLGTAQTQLNARNPFAEASRQAILGGQANVISGVERNAIDPSQALAIITGVAGQTNQSLMEQGRQDNAMQAQRTANLFNALQTNVGQENLANQFMSQKYQMDLGQKNALQSAGQQSIVNAGTNLAGTFLGASAQNTGTKNADKNMSAALLNLLSGKKSF